MNKLITLFFTSLALIGSSSINRLEAATIHTLLIADSEDDSLGKGFYQAVIQMQQQFQLVAYAADLELNDSILVGEKTLINNVLDAIDNLNIQPDDVVVVYAAIHGYRNASKVSKWPSLFFGVESRGLEFELINKKILAKKPRFLLSMADSCNNRLDFDFPTVGEVMVKSVLPNYDLIIENYVRLFTKSRGSVIVSSSQPGEFSWAYPRIGGIWTLEFLMSMDQAVTFGENSDWQLLMETIRNNVIKTQIKQKTPLQHAQFEVNVTY